MLLHLTATVPKANVTARLPHTHFPNEKTETQPLMGAQFLSGEQPKSHDCMGSAISLFPTRKVGLLHLLWVLNFQITRNPIN